LPPNFAQINISILSSGFNRNRIESFTTKNMFSSLYYFAFFADNRLWIDAGGKGTLYSIAAQVVLAFKE